MRARSTPCAFALVELGAVVTVAGVVASLLMLGFANERRLARLGSDEANLGRIGAMTGAYAADNADLFWTFSWKTGGTYSAQWPDLNNAPTDLQAGANQAVEILRRRAGRTDIQQITGWIPHLMHGHLVLEDYAPMTIPDRVFISSADKHRLLWASNPMGFDAGLYQPAPTGTSPGTNAGKRWPYSSSYQMPTTLYDRGPVGLRIYQAAKHNQFFVPFGDLGAVKLSECSNPSQKVLLHDAHARHFGTRLPFFSHDEARLPLLFVDGAVSVRSASESNPGWQPNVPSSSNPSTFNYLPDVWEPPTMSGKASEIVLGRFRWTRGTLTESGIVGRDFGGPEVGP